ncbi:hypothetical protein TSUD_368510 [Trifolium subterraneum]|uniref:Uncharacterized protein n=1 Tax=Trifolium subterraneum TaxID=3900 RepID=A0A2Z6LXE2_TRISU|nr:hypothetical protein TSUD_368510 [Trifolium subterraneum]
MYTRKQKNRAKENNSLSIITTDLQEDIANIVSGTGGNERTTHVQEDIENIVSGTGGTERKRHVDYGPITHRYCISNCLQPVLFIQIFADYVADYYAIHALLSHSFNLLEANL